MLISSSATRCERNWWPPAERNSRSSSLARWIRVGVAGETDTQAPESKEKMRLKFCLEPKIAYQGDDMDSFSSIASAMNCLWCKNMGMCNCVHDHHSGYDTSTSECYTYLQMDLLKTCWVFWSDVAARYVYHDWMSMAVCTFGLAHRMCCDKNTIWDCRQILSW